MSNVIEWVNANPGKVAVVVQLIHAANTAWVQYTQFNNPPAFGDVLQWVLTAATLFGVQLVIQGSKTSPPTAS